MHHRQKPRPSRARAGDRDGGVGGGGATFVSQIDSFRAHVFEGSCRPDTTRLSGGGVLSLRMRCWPNPTGTTGARNIPSCLRSSAIESDDRETSLLFLAMTNESSFSKGQLFES